jgi:hypothetical protein
MRRKSLALVFCCLLVTACAAHEKAGDSAAAVGDWRSAVTEYRTAVQRSPGDAKLRQKYAEAKDRAVVTSSRKAQSCAATGDWKCALAEADYVTSLDDSAGAALMQLRADAAKNVALAKLSAARAALARDDQILALTLIRDAAKLSGAAQVQDGVRATSLEWSSSAAVAAGRLGRDRRYPEALSLLTTAAEFDASLKSRLVSLSSEYDRYRTAEHDRLYSEGEHALATRDWADAAARFRASQEMLADVRAASLEKYAAHMSVGDEAIKAGNFKVAEISFREAAATGQDRGNVAKAAATAVAVRPFTIRIKSILVLPTRPDGGVWVGPPNPFLGRLVKSAVSGATGGAGAIAINALVDAVESVPPDNRPTMSIEVTLPDGRRLATPAHKTLYWNPASTLVVATNSFDRRQLFVRVVHREPNGAEEGIGTVEIPLGMLVSQRRIELRDASIASLEVVAEESSGIDGSFSQELIPARDASNLSNTLSVPTSGSRGFKLVRVEGRIVPPDYTNDLALDGGPDPYVELRQGGRIVYLSSVVKDQYDGSWIPERTFVFARPDEYVTVRLLDKDPDKSDDVIAANLALDQIASGQVLLTTQAGSYVRLMFEPRSTGP